MNRALWKPALVLVVLLVLATAGGLLFRGNTSSAQPPAAGPVDEPAPKVADVPKATDPPKTDEPAKAATVPPVVAAPQAGDNPKPAATQKTAAETGPALERRHLLETIGALTAAHCYQAYFNIGLLADGRAKGTYTDKDATRVLDSILSILRSVEQKLTGLDKLALEEADRASLAQMREISLLLRRQAGELQSFWDNGREEDAARYESARKDAWAAISKLLGIGRSR
jgi:hypothetical protein